MGWEAKEDHYEYLASAPSIEDLPELPIEEEIWRNPYPQESGSKSPEGTDEDDNGI